jgi:hypothetical protein
VRQAAGWWLLLLAGCAPALHPTVAPPGTDSTVDTAALCAQVQAIARRIETEPSSARRGALSTEAVEVGQRCDRAAPGSATCDYALALALGLQAREHPMTVREGLAQMATRLRRAAARQPELDRAGPERVLALLLVRAPGWPIGPGDPEEGLDAARRAVGRFPEHAPNLLALAEALVADGEPEEGREAARRALALAVMASQAGDPDAAGWQREALRLAGRP